MFKDTRDEMIVMLKRQIAEQEEKVKFLQKDNETLKKGESGAEAKIKALNEIHS